MGSLGLVLCLLAGTGVAGNPPIYSGYVGTYGTQTQGATIVLRSADTDFLIDLTKIDEKTKKTLIEADGKNKKVQVFIELNSNAVTVQKPKYGIRPDCSEIPISYEQLASVAQNKDVSSQADFLKQIPAGTLQTFTLLRESKSAQAPGISAEWPGVIRTSADGKTVLRYTCDPKSPVYNTVEIMSFDDATRSFKFTHVDFRPGKPHRTEENPKACMQCHNRKDSTSIDPKPIWPEYDTWPGAFGMRDDLLYDKGTVEKEYPDEPGIKVPEGENEYKNSLVKEFEQFGAFRSKKSDDLCYQSLPWPKNPPEEYKNFPYSDYRNKNGKDYVLRPNLKITDMESHLLAKRTARKISENPGYKALKYSILMDGLHCDSPTDGTFISKVLRKYKAASSAHSPIKRENTNEMDPTSFAPDLYSMSERLGLKPQDYTLRTNEDPTAYYTAGVARTPPEGKKYGDDVGITELIVGELLQSESDEDPSLKKYAKLDHGVASFFGHQFECIDQLGGPVSLQPNEKKELCGLLADKQASLKNEGQRFFRGTRRLMKNQIACESNPVNGLEDAERQVSEMENIVRKASITPESIRRGKEIVTSTCIKCHGGGGDKDDLNFFANEKALSERIQDDKLFINRINRRLNDSKLPMPPSGQLTDEDRTAIESYILNLSK